MCVRYLGFGGLKRVPGEKKVRVEELKLLVVECKAEKREWFDERELCGYREIRENLSNG